MMFRSYIRNETNRYLTLIIVTAVEDPKNTHNLFYYGHIWSHITGLSYLPTTTNITVTTVVDSHKPDNQVRHVHIIFLSDRCTNFVCIL